MNASILYLTKHLSDGDRMAIFVGTDLDFVVKDSIYVYDIDLEPHVVLKALQETDGTSVSFGSWTFTVGYLDSYSNLVLKMADVDYSDDWRGEDGDC